jgi:dephospho-CoA kinase
MEQVETREPAQTKRVAITGGIGSGKSYVCRRLERHGIRVYDCDTAAKRLMRDSDELREALRQLVGDEVYVGNVLQKPVMARFLLKSEANKQAVNDVVHPAVARDFEESGYTWLESAILFDSGFDMRTRFDYIICVTAPLEVRIRRVMKRDGISRQQALDWIQRQLPQDEVRARSDFEIVNDGKANIEKQIETIIKQIKGL